MFLLPTSRIPWLATALLLLLATALVCLGVGRYPIALSEVLRFMFGASGLSSERVQLLHSVLVDTRLPRILGAILVGAGLSVSGGAYQAVFRNPLVSPGLLGVLSGCALGAALGIVMGLHGLWVSLLACVCGLLAVGVGVGIAAMFRSPSILMLVLGGTVSNALFSSLLAVVQYTADPQTQLPTIVYWMLGSLAAIDQDGLRWIAPLLAAAIIALCLLGRVIDALSLSDDEAHSLGVPVHTIRYGVIALATLISALTVSLAGMVGWVGLLVPHLARFLAGPANARLLPLSACLGGSFLLVADAIARSATTGEIPLGIVTQLLGAIAFVLVLHRVRRGWL